MTATATRPASGSLLPWVSGLGQHGTRPALVTAHGTLTYEALSGRVDQVAARLGGHRRLVLVEGSRTPETVVAHLAALAAGHVVLLAPAGLDGPAGRLRAAYGPDIVLGGDGSVEIVRERSAHDLHPDLTLLLSTSGSTGSAKLVRLSAGNLAANAQQISECLGIQDDDCAAMTLPLSYTYGLSVLHTHLARGASVLLTDLSVVDDCFWTLFVRAGATTFPGVPHTFDLLERSGFADRHLPHLRYVTQAGGRMDPERVQRWAALGHERGWRLHVMYGQSEATARMASLPPELAMDHPETVGLPVPGATISIEDGEIVFRGPNVMLGYAHGPADLALGRTTDALHTGDLGRITQDGLLQVTGRRARFVKVFGHRIDLDGLEQRLRSEGHDVRCAGRDDLVVVSGQAVDAAPAREALRRAVMHAGGLPVRAVRVVAVDEHPTLASGKTDYATILRLAGAPPTSRGMVQPGRAEQGVGDVGDSAPTELAPVRRLYADLLQRDDVTDGDTFVSLGGDSLSYVEVSVRLEELLGHLPASWHVTAVGELDRLLCSTGDRVRTGEPGIVVPSERSADPDRGLRARVAGFVDGRVTWRSIESSVWLRALAIVLIVGTHADLFSLQGSANALLVIAGYQLARFQLVEPDRRARIARLARAARRIVVPTLVVILGAHVLVGDYETRNLFLTNWIFGEAELGPPWRFWFIEALVLALLLIAALTCLPGLDRLERRLPFGLPFGLALGAFVLLRIPVLPLPFPKMDLSALVVLHLFLFGWAIARARTRRQRQLLTVVLVVVVGTFSFNPVRDGLTLAIVLLLMWRPVTGVPAVLVPMIRILAAASLYIYVIHWQVLGVATEWQGPPLATIASLALGIAYWWCWTHLPTLRRRLVHAPFIADHRRHHAWWGLQSTRDPGGHRPAGVWSRSSAAGPIRVP